MLTRLEFDRPLAIVDLESTGVDPRDDRIVEISILKLRPQRDPDHWTRRVNPGRPIPAEATAIHGITDADVAREPSFAKLAAEVERVLEGCDLCGYNLLRFDLKLLLSELRRAGVSFRVQGRRLIDPCRIFHQREPRDLVAAMQFYCARDHAGAHGAEADVLATIAVLEAQLHRYADLPGTIGALHDHFRDPATVDVDGMFARRPDGSIVFTRGKYQGRTLDDIAATNRDYLEWMLRGDFFDDTKAVVSQALQPR
jgi:DNA polymerase-3 subunit epsilon